MFFNKRVFMSFFIYFILLITSLYSMEKIGDSEVLLKTLIEKNDLGNNKVSRYRLEGLFFLSSEKKNDDKLLIEGNIYDHRKELKITQKSFINLVIRDREHDRALDCGQCINSNINSNSFSSYIFHHETSTAGLYTRMPFNNSFNHPFASATRYGCFLELRKSTVYAIDIDFSLHQNDENELREMFFKGFCSTISYFIKEKVKLDSQFALAEFDKEGELSKFDKEGKLSKFDERREIIKRPSLKEKIHEGRILFVLQCILNYEEHFFYDSDIKKKIENSIKKKLNECLDDNKNIFFNYYFILHPENMNTILLK